MLAKGKVYATFKGKVKPCVRVDLEAMWDILKGSGLKERFLDGVKVFYWNFIACVKSKGEMAEKI